MEIFLTSMFCQKWLTNHIGLRRHANCHDLYSVGDERNVMPLLLRTQKVLSKHPYNPPLYCSFDIHGQLQTTIQFLIRNIGAQYLILSGKVVYERELLTVQDGGLVALDWITLSHLPSTPAPEPGTGTGTGSRTSNTGTTSGNMNTDTNPIDRDIGMDSASDVPTIILHHGLCGDSSSEHIVFMARKFLSSQQQQFRVVVVVMRGCGGLDLMTSQAMHGARTEDLRDAIQHIHKKLPKSRLFGVGFSLGAGVLLKYLGQEGPKSPLEAAYCVSPPWDGQKQSLFFPLWTLFLAVPVKLYALRQRRCFKSSVHLLCVLLAPTLGCVDALLTENHGYRSLMEYYSACSPVSVSHNIQVPTLSVSAKDDPVCFHDSAPAPFLHSSSSSSCPLPTPTPTPSLSSPSFNPSSSLTSAAVPSSSSVSSTANHHPLSKPLHSTLHTECDVPSSSESGSESEGESESDTEYKDPEYSRRKEHCSGDKLHTSVTSTESAMQMHARRLEQEQVQEQEQEQEDILQPTLSPVCRLLILKTLLGGHIAFPCTTTSSSSSSSSALSSSLSYPFSSWCESWCDDVALDWVLGFIDSA